MWCLFLVFFFFYRQDVANRQTAGIKFTDRRKVRFFAPQGRLVAPIHVNLAGPTGTWVRLAGQNFTSIATAGWESGPENIKNFHFLVKSHPVVGDSLD